jgi:hypothetical protein
VGRDLIFRYKHSCFVHWSEHPREFSKIFWSAIGDATSMPIYRRPDSGT